MNDLLVRLREQLEREPENVKTTLVPVNDHIAICVLMAGPVLVEFIAAPGLSKYKWLHKDVMRVIAENLKKTSILKGV
jgi:hypothetical protein